MKPWTILMQAAVGLLLASGALRAAEGDPPDLGKKMTDPVTLKAVTVAKDTPLVVVNRTRYYFTDAKTREMFLKAPETYLKLPLECPVRGIKGRAAKTNRLVVNDQIFYFCCASCPQDFTREPQNYVQKLVDPVTGKEFDLLSDSPQVTYKGTIYFFSDAERKAEFEKDPGKFARVLLP